jgi:hypothetical protein
MCVACAPGLSLLGQTIGAKLSGHGLVFAADEPVAGDHRGACDNAPRSHEGASSILRGGPILTINGQQADALALVDGKVLAVGGWDQVSAHRTKSTQIVELDGRAVLPGNSRIGLAPVRISSTAVSVAGATAARTASGAILAIMRASPRRSRL